jgi:hypothetical protein
VLDLLVHQKLRLFVMTYVLPRHSFRDIGPHLSEALVSNKIGGTNGGMKRYLRLKNPHLMRLAGYLSIDASPRPLKRPLGLTTWWLFSFLLQADMNAT